MPLYVYRCQSCQSEFEKAQSIWDDSLPPCPECEGETRKVITTPPTIQFVGDGFYVNERRGI